RLDRTTRAGAMGRSECAVAPSANRTTIARTPAPETWLASHSGRRSLAAHSTINTTTTGARHSCRHPHRPALSRNLPTAGTNGSAAHSGRALLSQTVCPVRVEEACTEALALGVREYHFVKRYLERQPELPLTLQQ